MMSTKEIFNKHILVFSFLSTVLLVMMVDFFNVPNPNVILLTGIVYSTFLGGFPSGCLSGTLVIAYSFYFFSEPMHIGSFTPDNLKRVIVIIVFIPVMILIVGTLKRKYDQKNKELEIANEKLKQLSTIDPLTGIPNRRYFDEALTNEYSRAAREQWPISLLIIDIDFFKNYNDSYGHLSGDHCLKMVAQVVSEAVHRTGDVVARYGGEEFVVLLPNTDTSGALWVGDEIINSISSLNIPHSTSKISNCVTVSIGASTKFEFAAGNPLVLIDEADKALYMAKNNGRNQIKLFSY